MRSGRARFASDAERLAWLAAALIAGAIVLGGGGRSHPASALGLELWAAGLALAWLWFARPALGSPRAIWAIAALALALPLAHLMPLPPAIWTALPGREAEQAALALIGEQDSWRPLSLSPPRTLTSLLSLGPPLLAMLMVAALDQSGRRLAIRAVAALALLSAVLGALQVIGGPGALRLYADGHEQWLLGFHNNRNHAADVLLIGMVALAAALAGATRPGRHLVWWWAAGTAVLLAATVLTGSRAGIALVPLALLGQWLILRPALPAGLARSFPLATAGAALLLALAAIVLRDNTALGAVLQRFAVTSDFRTELWTDSWYAMRQYWPVGAGIGAFVPVMFAAERLEVLDPTFPNNAHNDYLELAVTAGLPGLVVLAALGLLGARLALRKWRLREQPDEASELWFSLAALAIVALHSVVDYPLRMLALSTLAGVAVGLLAVPARRGNEAPPAGVGRTEGPE